MEKEKIGMLVKYERNKKGLDAKVLCRSICSDSVINRLEAGERVPDFFLLERIIERLGKSVNKLEFIYDESTYNICYLRELIEAHIAKQEYEEAEAALGHYEGLKEAEEKLHIQYMCKMRAVIEEKRGGAGSLELIEKAMEQTMDRFAVRDIKEYALGEEEVILLLMWLRARGRAEKEDITEYIGVVMSYIEYVFSDEEVIANLYSKAAWVFIEELEKKKRTADILSLGVRSIDILVSNGLLIHLPSYLELILRHEKEVDEEGYLERKKQRDTLKEIYEKYGKVYQAGEIELWKNYHLHEAYLISELIANERTVLNQTQEEMALEMGIDRKTISRIESGTYKPKPGTFRKIKEYLELDRDICNAPLEVEDFELLELERSMMKEMHYQRYEKAEKLYQELKSRLSMDYNINQQYIQLIDCDFEYIVHKNISGEDAVRRLEGAFRLTRKNCDLDEIDKVVLTKNEARIIHKIAIVYDKLGRKEEGIQLLEKAKAGYENSKVDTKYHYRELAMIYRSLGKFYEEGDRIAESLAVCAEGIRYDLRCERGLAISFLIEQLAFGEERLDGDKEASRRKYQQAYQYMKLMQREASIRTLRKYYEEHYGETLD